MERTVPKLFCLQVINYELLSKENNAKTALSASDVITNYLVK